MLKIDIRHDEFTVGLEDLINLGAYASGANPKLDAAIKLQPQLMDFLKQDASANVPFEQTLARLSELALQVG